VFENRALRRIFGPKKKEVVRSWKKLHNKELNCLYFSSRIVTVIKGRTRRGAGHIALAGR